MAIRPSRAKSSTGKRKKPAKADKRGTAAKKKKLSKAGTGTRKPNVTRKARLKPNPKFLKNGQTGSIPGPVEKWVDGLGATVPYNQPFLIDEDGRERDRKKIQVFCKKTFYVVYNFEEVAAKACGGLNLQPYVAKAETAAQKTASDVIATCEQDGCLGGSKVVYEVWMCSGVAAGGSSVNVQIVVEVECVEI